MNTLNEMVKIADIHADRIRVSIKRIEHLFPIRPDMICFMKEDDLVWIDFLINRFGKLQDLLGSKLIDLFLEQQAEDAERITMLDKLNKLERLGMIDSVELWKEMREVRNHIAHDYPDQPALTALYLNKIFKLAPQLLQIFDAIKKRIV